MRVAFAVALVAGVIGVGAWVLFVGEDERPAGAFAAIAAGATGLGMAGLSASYAGWPLWVAVMASLLGGAAGAALAVRWGR